MYSTTAMRITLIMYFSYDCVQHGLCIYLHCRSCKQVRQFITYSSISLLEFLHTLISPVLQFIILELFLLLFIPCIQKRRKLFDCNKHILYAQYHGKSYFLHIEKLIETKYRAEQQKFHSNNRI